MWSAPSPDRLPTHHCPPRVLLPRAQEALRHAVAILVRCDVPLYLAHMALQGLAVVDPVGRRQQTPAEALAAQAVDKEAAIAVVEVLRYIYRPGAEVLVYYLRHAPVAGEAQVVDVYVGALVLHLLHVPQREGVVVAQGDEYCPLVAALEVRRGYVAHGVLPTAVVVAPVAHRQRQRCQEEQVGELPPLVHLGRPHANPHREGVEREHIGVVALAGLVAGVVQVEVEHHTAHEEQQHHHPVALPVATPMAPEAVAAEQRRQHEEHHAAPLQVLAPREVVHQVAPVHVA